MRLWKDFPREFVTCGCSMVQPGFDHEAELPESVEQSHLECKGSAKVKCIEEYLSYSEGI